MRKRPRDGDGDGDGDAYARVERAGISFEDDSDEHDQPSARQRQRRRLESTTRRMKQVSAVSFNVDMRDGRPHRRVLALVDDRGRSVESMMQELASGKGEGGSKAPTLRAGYVREHNSNIIGIGLVLLDEEQRTICTFSHAHTEALEVNKPKFTGLEDNETRLRACREAEPETRAMSSTFFFASAFALAMGIPRVLIELCGRGMPLAIVLHPGQSLAQTPRDSIVNEVAKYGLDSHSSHLKVYLENSGAESSDVQAVKSYVAARSGELFQAFADGGARSNPGIAGCGGVIKASNGTNIVRWHHYLGESETNNVAEYMGLKMTLKLAKSLRIQKLCVSMDSQLVVKQVRGEWKVKAPHLQNLRKECAEMISALERVDLQYVPRACNTEADACANCAMDQKTSLKSFRPVLLE